MRRGIFRGRGLNDGRVNFFNHDVLGEVFRQRDIDAADVTDETAAVGEFAHFGEFAKPHFPQTLTDRRLSVDSLHADRLINFNIVEVGAHIFMSCPKIVDNFQLR